MEAAELGCQPLGAEPDKPGHEELASLLAISSNFFQALMRRRDEDEKKQGVPHGLGHLLGLLAPGHLLLPEQPEPG